MMLKKHIYRATFMAVVMSACPALADDAAVSQTLNDLSQQVQSQQKQIEKLQRELANKPKAKNAAATAQEQTFPSAISDQRKPGVVAPLQPTSLGTLSLSDIQHPELVTPVTQAAPAQAGMGNAPVPYVPSPYTQQQIQQQQAAHAQVSGAIPGPYAASTNTTSTAVAPGQHVGEAPPSSTKPPEVQALASVGGVLTPYGRVVIEPFMQYSRSSENSFVFNGVEVLSAILIGAVDANRTARDLVESGATFRLGVSDRAEVEARVPFVFREDTTTNTVQNLQGQYTSSTSTGYGIGDVELAGHYQINKGQADWPFFIGNLRYKSDTGTSPYTVSYDDQGNPKTLATGSGFMAVEPSLTAIYPSDPATLFANLGYIHSFDKDVNRTITGNFVGNVAPGDTYSMSVGMGVALNDRLSFTLGYEHDYVRPTATVISGVTQYSDVLQVGSALTGVSYKVNDRTSVNFSLAAGVTRDAPDAVVGLRVPISLQAF